MEIRIRMFLGLPDLDPLAEVRIRIGIGLLLFSQKCKEWTQIMLAK
jgi:hypothetical protein